MSKKTDYDRIKSVWYKKLKDEGFKDIEHDDNSINASSLSRSFKWKDPELRQIVQDYYAMAYHFLNEHAFTNELEKVMWEYHTNGLSIRNIVKLLNQVSSEKTNRIKVWKIIKKLEDTMKGLYLST